MNPRNRRPEDASPKAGSATGTNGSANGGANGGGAGALAKAVSLHLEGKRQEALQELKGAASHAGETAELRQHFGSAGELGSSPALRICLSSTAFLTRASLLRLFWPLVR